MTVMRPANTGVSTGYTRKSLKQALHRVLMRQGGAQSLFSHHRAIRDGADAETYAARFERFDLEKKVGIVACIFGPNYAGDIGIVCRAYMDLCTRQAFQFSRA
jgi:hypothetical protein